MNFFETISEIFFWMLASLIWVLVSVITLGSYQYLAGDSIFPLTEVNLFLGTPIAILLFVAIITNILKKRFLGYYGYQMEKASRYLSFIALWMLLPIAMNALSTIMKMLGSAKHADYLYNLRYHSLWLSVLLVVVTISLYHLKKPA
jgi:hypothetical protein